MWVERRPFNTDKARGRENTEFFKGSSSEWWRKVEGIPRKREQGPFLESVSCNCLYLDLSFLNLVPDPW